MPDYPDCLRLISDRLAYDNPPTLADDSEPLTPDVVDLAISGYDLAPGTMALDGDVIAIDLDF